MARRKNTRRFDPRYFMSEKTDVIIEATGTITVRDIERMLPSGVMAEYPGAARILLKRALAAKMNREELTQKIRAAGIKDSEHPRQFFRRLGFEYDLNENVVGEADDNEGTLREPFAGLVRSHAVKAIKIIDRGLAKDDDPEHLKILREAFENILEYDKNEMADYLNDWAEHIKTPRLRQQLTSMALVFEHSQGI